MPEFNEMQEAAITTLKEMYGEENVSAKILDHLGPAASVYFPEIDRRWAMMMDGAGRFKNGIVRWGPEIFGIAMEEWNA